MLVEVALDGGDGERGVATHLGGGEIRPGGEETCIERCAPRGQGRGEHGGVIEGNALGDRGVSGGEELSRGSERGRSGRRGRGDMPEARGWCAVAMEDGAAVKIDGDALCYTGDPVKASTSPKT